MTELNEWHDFYVIVGSSAGALIGLQFVVLTLIAERPHPKMAEAGAAFATPSVIHFTIVLLLAALLSVPWQGSTSISITWGLVGVYGMVYSMIVLRRLKTQRAYRPVFEDWMFHLLLPFAAYATLTVVAFIARHYEHNAFVLVGVATLVLLFVGIHNAWDGVTYHVFTNRGKTGTPNQSGEGES